MRIVVIGRGNVGGGLTRLWQRAGHDVTALGHDGGNASDADVVVVAVPGGAIADAFERVDGLQGKPAIDTTNTFGSPPDEFRSLAEQVGSLTGGPVAKAFNTNFATLYDRIADESAPPSSVFVADRELRDTAERLIRDAGFHPVFAGGIQNAPVLEAQLRWTMLLASDGPGPFFYRLSVPWR